MENMDDQSQLLNFLLRIKNKEKPSLFQKIKDENLSSDKNELFNIIKYTFNIKGWNLISYKT